MFYILNTYHKRDINKNTKKIKQTTALVCVCMYIIYVVYVLNTSHRSANIRAKECVQTLDM